MAFSSSEDGPGWPYFSPALAQRDVMRRYYLSTSAQEMLEIVQSSSEILDVNTSLDLLCHTGVPLGGMLGVVGEVLQVALLQDLPRCAGVLPLLPATSLQQQSRDSVAAG